MDTECPVFTFKTVGAYSDPLRRQLLEALRILKTGTLNKRNEFGSNELCRVIPSMSGKEHEAFVDKQRNDRMKYKENFVDFKNVMSKICVYPSKMSNILSTISRKKLLKRADREESSTDTKGISYKRPRTMETSTPLHRIGSSMRMPQGEISISPLGESNASSGEDLESVNAEDIKGTERTGLSDKLDGTALTPVKSITESKEEENLYAKVEELTGAAYGTGLIKRSSSEPDIIIPLEKNAFVTNKWKERRIINNVHYMTLSA